jgi:histone H3/H4
MSSTSAKRPLSRRKLAKNNAQVATGKLINQSAFYRLTTHLLKERVRDTSETPFRFSSTARAEFQVLVETELLDIIMLAKKFVKASDRDRQKVRPSDLANAYFTLQTRH